MQDFKFSREDDFEHKNDDDDSPCWCNCCHGSCSGCINCCGSCCGTNGCKGCLVGCGCIGICLLIVFSPVLGVLILALALLAFVIFIASGCCCFFCCCQVFNDNFAEKVFQNCLCCFVEDSNSSSNCLCCTCGGCCLDV